MIIIIIFGLWLSVVLLCEVIHYNNKKNGVIQDVTPSQFVLDHMNIVTRIYINGEEVRNFCRLVPNSKIKYLTIKEYKNTKKIFNDLKVKNKLLLLDENL